MDEITVPASQIRKMNNLIEGLDDTADIGFTFVMTMLFPTVYHNIEAKINEAYTSGYLQRKEEEENDNQKLN